MTGTSLSPESAPISPEEVRNELSRILASAHFVSSQRLCRFLRFVVERSLENDSERLKEFVLALEVFDRNEDYDPNVDSIVRVEARRLRNKLKAYYETDGAGDPLSITLRPGSYSPVVERMSQVAVELQRRPPESPSTTIIAVLPFVNMSPEPEQDYFCDGITEEIINALASVESLSVVARTSAFQFKGKNFDIREAGERLGAQVVVEGSVRKAGNQLRITAQAIDATRGYHLWSETYARRLEDVFAVQEEISTAIAEKLRVKLPERVLRSGASQPSLDAYTRFLKGMFLVRQQNVPSLYAALEHFQQLTRVYPDYAPPYAGIAAAHGFLALFGVVSGRDVLAEMKRNALMAVRLDPMSAEAWAVTAGINAHWEYNWAEGEDCFRRAISLRPSNPGPRTWYGMMLVMLGRFDEAEAQLKRVGQLNPLAPADHTRMGYLHYVRDEDAEAAAQFEFAAALEPEFPETRLMRGLLCIKQRRYADAVEILSKDLELPLAAHIGMLGLAYGRWGKTAECRSCLDRLHRLAQQRYVTPLATAWVHHGLGDNDRSFEDLEQAIAHRTIFAEMMNVDPVYAPLRSDPRFARLLQLLKLSPR